MESAQHEQTQGGEPQGPPSSLDEYRKALQDDMRKQGLLGETQEDSHEMIPWYKKLNAVMSKQRDPMEIARSIPRGALGAAKETQGTIQKLTKDSNPIISAAGELGSKISSKVQSLFGQRSDDGLAAFTEDATQFTLPFLVSGGLNFSGVVGEGLAPAMNASTKAATTMGKLASSAAHGAVVDFSAFNAHGGNIGDLIAKIPDRGPLSGMAHDFGEMLKVDADDSEMVGKIKNAAAGMIPAVVLDGLFAGVRRARGVRMGDAAAVEKNTKILQDIANGTHVPDGAHVVVKETDGGFKIEPKDGPMEKTVDDPWAEPKFATRAEAEQQAETINYAMNEHITAAKNAGGLTQGDAEQLRTTFQRMLTSPGPIDLQKMMEGTHLNFSYFNETHEQLAMIESISEVFQKEMDASQASVSKAEEFRMAREMIGGMSPDQAPALMTKALREGTESARNVKLVAADWVLKDLGDKTAKFFDILEARPHDAIAWEQARHSASAMLDLQKALAGSRSIEGRALNSLKHGDEFRQSGDVGFATDAGKKAGVAPEKPTFDSPKAKALVNDGEHAGSKAKAPKQALPQVAGMDQREILEVLRMAKMSGGEPRNLFAVGHAAKIVQEEGMGRKVLEYFVNSLLSSPVTFGRAMTMNAAESTYRAVSKMIGGGLTGNGAMLREGWDILYANERYLADNFKTALAAARAGRSIINPTETHIAIKGAPGDVIRSVGSKPLMFADEFTRVSNYRSYIRAKSLRVWREKGLTGPALYSEVEKDLAAAFDKETGIATVPAALKYAEGPTFSAPLEGRVGKNLSTFLNNTLEAKFVAPFVKTSVNIFGLTFDRTPLINMFLKRNRDVLLGKMGKEAAADLWSQTAMAGSTYAYAYFKAKSGEVTGRAPKDPALKALWLQDHKEYSIKVNGRWVSYRSGDPLFTPLGLVADGMMIADEAEAAGDDQSFGDVANSTVAALAASFSNKTYMQGLTQFMDAWSSGDGNKMQKWINGMVTGFTAPSIVQSQNTDPYYREVDGMIEATMARYPGLSEKLPARYNIFGEPEAKYVSVMPFPDKGPADPTVATDLLSIGKGFAGPQRKIEGVDLGDRDKFGNKDGVTPWDRLQELIREPKGKPPMRDALTALVNSPKWQRSSEGSIQFPGGERWKLAAEVIDNYQERAMRQVEKEYPALLAEIKLQQKLKGVSFRKGQSAADQLLNAAGR